MADDDSQLPPLPICLICGSPMAVDRVHPKVGRFPELKTFRCDNCGDVRTIEQE